MKKLIIYCFVLYGTLLYSCATCQLMSPSTDVKLTLDIEDKRLTTVHMQWTFSEIYSSEILMQYDKNRNTILDAQELNTILQIKVNYLLPKNMLTKIKYAKNEQQDSSEIKASYKKFDLKMIDGILIFSYDCEVDLIIDDKSILAFIFEDDESYFSFIASSVEIENSSLYVDQNLYLFSAALFFSYTPLDIQENLPKEIDTEELQKREKVKEKTLQLNLLEKSIAELKSLFKSIKEENNPYSYMILLFFAYVYGVIHALGPGHGKTLVGSYFFSNECSYSKALYISLAIGVVHTFSAFLLTLLVYFVVDTFLAQFIDESLFYTTKISAIMIILIALYLLYKKYKAYTQTCACNSCKIDTNSTDLALIISAGIIPCPGTVSVFIFAMAMNLYYLGFFAALAMSLGMSSIIFISALVSSLIRKKTTTINTNLKKSLEYGSLGVILLLGVLLLLA